MRHYAQLLRETLTTSLMLAVIAGAAFAGEFEDATAAYNRGDYATALHLISALAGQGDADAQFNLGLLYNKGKGVTQNYVEALKWYGLAADQAHPGAQLNLGVMYKNGKGVPQDYAEAVKWYRLAADQGIAEAQYNMGIMYKNGQGVPKDYVQAHMWFNLAASQFSAWKKENRADAIEARDFLASKMIPAQIAEAQKLARDWKPKPER
jgi:uncharacterized protein